MEAANRKEDRVRIWDTLAKELLLAAKNEVNSLSFTLCTRNKVFKYFQLNIKNT